MDNNFLIQKFKISSLNQMQKDVDNIFATSDSDIVILSPTGTGKTLAYLFPLLKNIDLQKKHVQALVITPTRELALQSSMILCNSKVGIRSMACYGGRPTMFEHKLMKYSSPQIIFGTPGRLKDHVDKQNLFLPEVRYIVIDEFDKCLQMGFLEEVKAILRGCVNVKRKILLSATNLDEIPQYVSLSNTKYVEYKSEQINKKIKRFKFYSQSKDKLKSLKTLLVNLGNESSIVFVNYRDSVERIINYLSSEGFVISYIHGGLDQKQREAQLYRFTNHSTNIMVATNLASRGLDIPNVMNIIHYHLPEDNDAYIHREGRTARWNKTGKSFLILSPEETVPEFIDDTLTNVEFEISKANLIPLPTMVTLYIGKGKKEKISKGDVLGFLCKEANLGKQDVGQIDVKERYTYVAISREKLNEVLKLTKGKKIKGIKTIIEPVM